MYRIHWNLKKWVNIFQNSESQLGGKGGGPAELVKSQLFDLKKNRSLNNSFSQLRVFSPILLNSSHHSLVCHGFLGVIWVNSHQQDTCNFVKLRV